MGLLYHEVRELLLARRAGIDFTSTATVGRQQLFLSPAEGQRLAEDFGVAGSAWGAFRGYADDFFRSGLGVEDLQTIDVSDYEGAAIVHDQNTPVGPELTEQFDVVLDGGTLEHVFNVPTALANLMRMTKVGGHVVICTPANNLCGHGFYQFSPELMYRVFTESRGFALETMSLTEFAFPNLEGLRRRSYTVVDPQAVRERVGLRSGRSGMLFVLARKLHHDDDPFADPPQQSDYVARWDTAVTRTWRGKVADLVPSRIAANIRGVQLRRRFSTSNRDFYRPRP